ncbi:MAG: N-acetylneuraminate synthase [Bacteroidia bacterium]
MSIVIIAEAGVNHNGSIDLAMQLIDVAVNAGADMVKFQTFKAESVVTKNAKKADYQIENTGTANESQYDMIKKLELSYHDFVILKDYATSKGILFGSTAFDMDSVDFLKSLNLNWWKIPSGEITNLPYLRKIGAYNEPTIISTGMANLAEVANAINALIDAGLDREKITVLHCNTEYPSPLKDVNLKAMVSMGNALGVKFGYSDHTAGINVSVIAAALGATVLEKHFTMSNDLEGPDHKASLNPEDLKNYIKAIRETEIVLGNGIKNPSESEKKNIDIARRSIFFSKSLKRGDVITENDLVAKRPGNGISPMQIDSFVGKVLTMDVLEDEMLTYKHIEW